MRQHRAAVGVFCRRPGWKQQRDDDYLRRATDLAQEKSLWGKGG